MSKVSVIIPCFNAGTTITRSLEALEHQDYKDFDIFIIDDCSTDDTINVVEKYRETSSLNIHILNNNSNLGPAESRKHGVLASRSDFICFCDSDDWYESNFLREMTDSQSCNNADVVFCSFRFVFDSGRRQERLNIYDKSDLDSINKALIKAPDSLCVMMVRRSILLSVPHPSMRNGEDMALIPLIVSRSSCFSAVNKCLYNYYCRSSSASMKPSLKMIESLEESFLFIEHHLDSSFCVEKEFIGIRNLLYGALINLFKFSFDKNKASQIIDGFEATYPDWYQNQFINELPLSKKTFLFLVYERLWFFARVLSLVHSMLLKYLQ